MNAKLEISSKVDNVLVGIKLIYYIVAPRFFTTLSKFLLISDDRQKIAMPEYDENNTNEYLQQFNHLNYIWVIVFIDIMELEFHYTLVKIIFAYYLCYAINFIRLSEFLNRSVTITSEQFLMNWVQYLLYATVKFVVKFFC